MSQPVIYVCYGIPLSQTPSGQSSGKTDEMRELIESGVEGFFSYYSSNAIESTPSGFGVQIMTCYPGEHHTNLQDCITKEVMDKYNRLYLALDSEIKEQLKMFGEPGLFLLWATY